MFVNIDHCILSLFCLCFTISTVDNHTFLKAKRTLFKKYYNVFNKIKGISIYRESKNANSNYWLQTLILDKNKSILKNKILKESHKKLIFTRPVWKLISDLKPYKKSQKMNLSGAKEIYNRIINIPSSQSLILKKMVKENKKKKFFK